MRVEADLLPLGVSRHRVQPEFHAIRHIARSVVVGQVAPATSTDLEPPDSFGHMKLVPHAPARGMESRESREVSTGNMAVFLAAVTLHKWVPAVSEGCKVSRLGLTHKLVPDVLGLQAVLLLASA